MLAVALATGGLTALAVPASATSPVDATNYGVTCTGQTGSMSFSPPLSSAVVTGTETIAVATTLSGCTAKVPTGGTAITISKGTVTGTLTGQLNGQSGYAILTGAGGSVAPTGNLSVAWKTATGSPTLSSGPTVINVLSTGVGFTASGNIVEGNVDLTIPGATKGTVSGSFSANPVYSFDNSLTTDTVGQFLQEPTISSLGLSGGLVVLGVKPTLTVTPSSSTSDPPYGIQPPTPYFAEAKYGTSSFNVSQLVDWSTSNPAVTALDGVSFVCNNQVSGVGDCENVNVGHLGSGTVTATLGAVSASSTRTNVPGPSIVTPTSVPHAVVGQAYDWPITATGGIPPYTVKSGFVPADGLTVQQSPPAIVGTPTAPGTYSIYDVQVADASGASVFGGFTVTVDAAATPLSISTTSLPGGTEGSDYAQVLVPTGGSGNSPTPYAWTVSSGSLPAGLTLNSTGEISGSPTSTGTSTFTVQVTDGSAHTATQDLSIAVGPALSDAPSLLPEATVDASYSQALAAPTGGTGPYSFTLESGTVPDGLTLNPDGTITGNPTPVDVGPNAFSVLVTDSSDPTQFVSLPESLTVDPGTPDTSTTTTAGVSPSTIVVGQTVTFSSTVSGAGGTPTGTVTFTDGDTLLATCTLYQGSTLSNCATSTAPTGTYTVTATYSGDTVFASSSGTTSLTVDPLTPTTTTVTVDPTTVGSLGTVTYSVSVTPQTGPGSPDGYVSIYAGSTLLCDAYVPTDPSCTANNAPIGTDTITADYAPLESYPWAGSSGTTTLTVTPTPPSVTTASVNPTVSTRGTVTYSATVAPATGPGTPTGTVTFTDTLSPTTTICSAPLSGGTGSCSGVDNYGGVETITASYSGDGSFAPSSGTTTLTNYTSSKSDTKCTGLSTLSGTATFSGCTVPGYSGLRTATAPSSVLLVGGTVTLVGGFGTLSLVVSSTSPGQGSCATGKTEHITSGIVASATVSTYLSGFPVKFKVCESGSGQFTLVPGQKLKL
jgi:hypothetical protein